VLSAHFDHLGKEPEGEGDRIYNGAVDNCAASAAMLAVARHFAARRGQLRTHLIFLGATAEEEGLHGSRYFASLRQGAIGAAAGAASGRAEGEEAQAAACRRGGPIKIATTTVIS
jgi:Zn-dependent M28 family amino/carboxypeptidase